MLVSRELCVIAQSLHNCVAWLFKFSRGPSLMTFFNGSPTSGLTRSFCLDYVELPWVYNFNRYIIMLLIMQSNNALWIYFIKHHHIIIKEKYFFINVPEPESPYYSKSLASHRVMGIATTWSSQDKDYLGDWELKIGEGELERQQRHQFEGLALV